MKILISLILLSFPLVGNEVEALLIPYRLVELGFPKDGIVRKLHYKEGDHVPAGNLMAQQENLNETLRLEHATKVLEQRIFDAESHQKLFEKNMVSKDIFLEKKLAHEVSLIEKQRADVQLKERSLLAPFNGVIVRLSRQEGEWSRSGEPLYQLFDPTKLYAEALLEPHQTESLKIGQSLKLRGPDSAKGVVEFISPLIDATSNLVRVKLALNNRFLKWKAGSIVQIQLP
jgi:RND family efflux transporter MFP subunit